MLADDTLRILVVDDDPKIGRVLKNYLTDEGFAVSLALNGREMWRELAQQKVDLITLDLSLPGADGLSLTRDLRRKSDIPIIMMTGKGDPIDRVAGLEVGADDYITKPFHLREVLARIRTVLRRLDHQARSSAVAEGRQDPEKRVVYGFGDWTLDPHSREVRTADGKRVGLTSGEFNLLFAFVTHPNRVLSREFLLDTTKGIDCAPYDRSIDTQVGRLRKKLQASAGGTNPIETVRGAGYIMTAQVTKSAAR